MTQKMVIDAAVDSIVCASNVRTQVDEQGIDGLSQTFKAVGVQQPILVRRSDGKLIVIDGARRLAAAKKIGLATIPAIVEEQPLSSVEATVRQFIANSQREDISPLEKADAIAAIMKETQWTASQTAANLGLSNSAVTRLLSLLQLPDSLRKMVADGTVTVSAAYELATVQDTQRQAELAAQLAKGGLTRDGLSGAVKRHKKAAGEMPRVSRAMARLSAGRSVTVVAGALTLESFIEVLEELLGRARQARPKGLALGTFLKVLRDQSKQ
jgi:ParB/RepB/Spo0J family partition protein